MGHPNLDNDTGFEFLDEWLSDEMGTPVCCTVVKASFDLDVNGTLSLRPEPIAIDTSGSYNGEPGQSSLRTEPETAFTAWLDPALAVLQAAAIRDALSAARPAAAADFDARFASLATDLDGLDEAFEQLFQALGDAPVVFSHPVYQYLEARYGINGISVHWEPDQAPDGHAWEHIEGHLETQPARWMVWEGEPLESTVDGLTERGISSVVFNPCGNRPDEGDYLTVMAANAVAFGGLGVSIE